METVIGIVMHINTICMHCLLTVFLQLLLTILSFIVSPKNRQLSTTWAHTRAPFKYVEARSCGQKEIIPRVIKIIHLYMHYIILLPIWSTFHRFILVGNRLYWTDVWLNIHWYIFPSCSSPWATNSLISLPVRRIVDAAVSTFAEYLLSIGDFFNESVMYARVHSTSVHVPIKCMYCCGAVISRQRISSCSTLIGMSEQRDCMLVWKEGCGHDDSNVDDG